MVDSIEFRTDRSGVSTVSGVILMIAVIMSITAVIGSSALGVSDEVSEAPPQAQLQIDEKAIEFEDIQGNETEALAVEITHTSGETFDTDNIEITIDGKSPYAASYMEDDTFPAYSTRDDAPQVTPWDYDLGTELTAGDKITLITATSRFETGEFGENDLVLRNNVIGENRIHLYGYHDDDSSTSYHRDSHLKDGDTVRVTWESGDQSQVISEHEIEELALEE